MKQLLTLYTSPARRSALHAIVRICTTNGAHIQKIVMESNTALTNAEANLSTELTYGYMRYKIRIDAILAQHLRATATLPKAYCFALGLAVYELLYMEESGSSSIVFHTVESIKRRYGKQLAGVANGVLRSITRKKSELLTVGYFLDICQTKSMAHALHYSLPEYIWEALCARYQEHSTIVAEFLCSRPIPAIVYTAKHSYIYEANRTREHARKPYKKQAITCCTSYKPSAGYNTATEILLTALGIERISGHIWDCCTGRGGKQLALYKHSIVVDIASDIYLPRLMHNTVSSTTVLCAMDACSPAYTGEVFDAIIADVPCSGTGTIRKRPDIKYVRTITDVQKLVATQKRILEQIAPLVKMHGYIVYITCSILGEENELQVRNFLSRHKNFMLRAESIVPVSTQCNDLLYGVLLQKCSA